MLPFPSIDMAEEIRRLWEALRRHRRSQPTLYRVPYWCNKFEILKRIDEVIQIKDENDRYGEPHSFEESDANGRWMLRVAEYHERCRAIAIPPDGGWNLGTQSAVSQQTPSPENLAIGLIRIPPGPDEGADQTLGLVNGRNRETVQPEGSQFSPGLSAQLSQAAADSLTIQSRPCFSRDTQDSYSRVAEGGKDNNKGTEAICNANDSSAVESDSSDDEGMDADADDGEQERIFQLFEDFPTCVQKVRHLPAIDSDDHGIMLISNPEAGWSHVDPVRLPPRIRKYLAEFTVFEAATFPDGVSPDLEFNGAGSHRWLLATERKEFICDTSTLDVWYRSTDHSQQPKPPQQPL